MKSVYGVKNRTGKQCRERIIFALIFRWHNHLDPNVNKKYWDDNEEAILLIKHLEFGNKWSEFVKFLPGRSDNCIKNHFYSKLRKFIRKILKQLNKEINCFKIYNIDTNLYNSDKIYRLIKKYKLPYNSLNKDTVLDLILKNERGANFENIRIKQKSFFNDLI